SASLSTDTTRSCCFSCSCYHRDLHSFPTRRSSDLSKPAADLRIGAVRGRARKRRRLGLRGHRDVEGHREELRQVHPPAPVSSVEDRKSTRLNSSHLVISYAVFCLKKKKQNHITRTT